MIMSLVLAVATEFSRTPGSRYISEGDFSGEQFRKQVLLPRVRDALTSGQRLRVELDGTAGYGTSFLEEAFGGLVRDDGIEADRLRSALELISVEEPYLIDDIWDYVADAESARGR